MKQIIFVISITILFAACSRTIPLYTDDSFEPNLVISAILGPQMPIQVYVSKTALPTQLDSTIFIKDAKVQILENEQVVANLSLKYPEMLQEEYMNAWLEGLRPYYTADYQLLDGHTYTLKIEAMGKTITKEFSFPEKVSNVAVNFNGFPWAMIEENGWYNCNYDSTVTLTINDIPGKNYYMIDLFIKQPEFFWDSINGVLTDSVIVFEEQHLGLYSADIMNDIKGIMVQIPYISAEYSAGNSFYFAYSYLYSDALFNQSVLTFNNYLHLYQYLKENQDLVIYYRLITVSEDLFNYYISEEKVFNTEDNPFVEPVNLYSNIESTEDYGLIATYNYHFDSIVIPFSNIEIFEDFEK